jgi:hypothetical protein
MIMNLPSSQSSTLSLSTWRKMHHKRSDPANAACFYVFALRCLWKLIYEGSELLQCIRYRTLVLGRRNLDVKWKLKCFLLPLIHDVIGSPGVLPTSFRLVYITMILAFSHYDVGWTSDIIFKIKTKQKNIDTECTTYIFWWLEVHGCTTIPAEMTSSACSFLLWKMITTWNLVLV